MSLGSQSRTPNWGRGTRTQEGPQETKRSGTQGQGKDKERKGLHPGTEERTGQVGPRARKRQEGWDPGLRNVTEKREGTRLREQAGSLS